MVYYTPKEILTLTQWGKREYWTVLFCELFVGCFLMPEPCLHVLCYHGCQSSLMWSQPESFRLCFMAQWWLEDTIPKRLDPWMDLLVVTTWNSDSMSGVNSSSKIRIYLECRWSPRDKFNSIHHFHVWLWISSLVCMCCCQSVGFVPYRVNLEYALVRTHGISTLMWISSYIPCSQKGNQDFARWKQLLFSVPDASNGVGVRGRIIHPSFSTEQIFSFSLFKLTYFSLQCFYS